MHMSLRTERQKYWKAAQEEHDRKIGSQGNSIDQNNGNNFYTVNVNMNVNFNLCDSNVGGKNAETEPVSSKTQPTEPIE